MTHPLVERVLSGTAPPQLKQAAAHGALPIPREDLLELWVLLRADSDGDIRMACKESLAEVSEDEWKEILPAHPFDPRVLDFAVRVLGKNQAILQAALKNKGVPDETLEWLAQNTTGQTIDALLENQVRLLNSPSVVVALLSNNGLSPTQVRRIFDLSEQFFRNHPQIPSLLEQRFGLKVGHAGGDFAPELAGEEEEVAEESHTSEAEAEVEPEALEEEGELEEVKLDEATLKALEGEIPAVALSDGPLSQEEFQNLFQQILVMAVPAKIGLATRGNKEARGLLIRDSNKTVQMAVIGSPKITESEVESIAKMRSLPDEVLRKIARQKEWMKKYPILKALATNPKTPPGIAIVLITRLKDFDMKMLLKDKNVSEVVRREAKKLWAVRTTRKVVAFKKK